MSKKKNTLKDLDDFLKQQAATLVSPAKLSDQIETPQPPPAAAAPLPVAQEVVTPAPASVAAPAPVVEVTSESILESIRTLAKKEGTTVPKKIYDIILQSAAQGTLSKEDTMLINTVLYLKSGDNWKDVIREYWKKR
ncbi:MAG TPA: hypothetical protein VIN08_23550 [Ohtaekwangia sp.]|uniref:hypothetical protein n=1 Tax=Ohtaekwangia sp. TaxID=2066019 RepID=UPI002F92929B